MKVQSLQKRLIGKSEEIAEKDCIVNEKEKLYAELKNLLARQPRGEAFGLPSTDFVQTGVGNGGGVDDDLGASVSDEDDVHGGRRYRTRGAV